MKVESIKIKNFKAIVEENLQLKGNNVYVTGKNGVGKSSFIDSIFKIISGKDLPSKLTNKDAKNGYVEIDLGNFKVKASFNEKNEKIALSIESKDGAMFKSPRTMLDESAGVIDFDLNNFFSLSPKKQVDFIKQLIGIDFTDLDDQYKIHYDDRTIINRTIKDLEAQHEFVDPKQSRVVVPIKEIQDKLQKANDDNAEIKKIADRKDERTKQIESLKEQLRDLENKQKNATEWLSKNTIVDIEVLTKELNDLIESNKKVEKAIQADKKAKDLKDQLALQEEVEENLKSIEETKRGIISEAKLPVPGLTFTDNELLYNGLPFEKAQINTAQQIIIGLQINLALLNDIKIARFDGSLLDNENMALVEAWAKENGLQLFVEFVERNTEGLRIEIKEEKEEPVTA